MIKKISFLLFISFIFLSACNKGEGTPIPTPGDGQPTLPASDVTAIQWTRSGGIAGICRKLSINFDGSYILEDCIQGTIIQGMLSSKQWGVLQNWIDTYQVFKWEFNPPAGSADMFSDAYTFNGKGYQIPGNNTMEEINQYLGTLISTLNLNQVAPTESKVNGIAGQILIGPVCAGPISNDPVKATACADQPYQATILVLDGSNVLITSFISDGSGSFRVPLDPSTYILHPETRSDSGYPNAGDQTVIVSAGVYTQVNIIYDSGLR